MRPVAVLLIVGIGIVVATVAFLSKDEQGARNRSDARAQVQAETVAPARAEEREPQNHSAGALAAFGSAPPAARREGSELSGRVRQLVAASRAGASAVAKRACNGATPLREARALFAILASVPGHGWEALAAVLKDNEVQLDRRASAVGAWVGARRVPDDLESRLTERVAEDDPLAPAAIDGLARLARRFLRLSPERSGKTRDLLLEQAVTASTPARKAALLRGAGALALGDPPAVVWDALNDPVSNVRVAAVGALRACHDKKRTRAALARALHEDSEEGVRLAALVALHARNELTHEELVEVASRDASPQVKGLAKTYAKSAER